MKIKINFITEKRRSFKKLRTIFPLFFVAVLPNIPSIGAAAAPPEPEVIPEVTLEDVREIVIAKKNSKKLNTYEFHAFLEFLTEEKINGIKSNKPNGWLEYVSGYINPLNWSRFKKAPEKKKTAEEIYASLVADFRKNYKTELGEINNSKAIEIDKTLCMKVKALDELLEKLKREGLKRKCAEVEIMRFELDSELKTKIKENLEKLGVEDPLKIENIKKKVREEHSSMDGFAERVSALGEKLDKELDGRLALLKGEIGDAQTDKERIKLIQGIRLEFLRSKKMLKNLDDKISDQNSDLSVWERVFIYPTYREVIGERHACFKKSLDLYKKEHNLPNLNLGEDSITYEHLYSYLDKYSKDMRFDTLKSERIESLFVQKVALTHQVKKNNKFFRERFQNKLAKLYESIGDELINFLAPKKADSLVPAAIDFDFLSTKLSAYFDKAKGFKEKVAKEKKKLGNGQHKIFESLPLGSSEELNKEQWVRKCQQLNNTRQRLSDQNEKLRTENQRFGEMNAGLIKNNQELNGKLNGLNVELEELKTKNAGLPQFKSKNQELNVQLNALNEELKELKEELKEARDVKLKVCDEGLRKNNEKLRNENQELKKSNIKKQLLIDSSKGLSAELKDFKSKHQVLRGKLGTLNGQLGKLENENQVLKQFKSEHEGLSKKLETLNLQLAQLKTENKNLIGSNKGLKEQLKDQLEEGGDDTLKTKNQRLSEELNQLKNKNKGLNGQLDQLKNENKGWKHGKPLSVGTIAFTFGVASAFLLHYLYTTLYLEKSEAKGDGDVAENESEDQREED